MSSDTVVKKGDPMYEKLLATWKDEKKPARLVVGSRTYLCVQNMDGDMEFRALSQGMLSDEMGSTSREETLWQRS